MIINLQLNKTQLKVCKNLIYEKKFYELKLNKTFLTLNNCGIGKIYNNLISFSETDIELINTNIIMNEGISSRGDAQLNKGNEKSSANKGVHKNEILIRATNILKINNKEINTLNGALLINYDSIKSVQNKEVIIIENYETFLNFKENRDFLIIYRGEKKYNIKNVYSFLNNLKLEVFVFPDYDLSGLINAKSYKGFFIDIYIKNINNLEELFIKYGNQSLFNKQNYNISPLENKPNFNIILNLIYKYKSALLQEGVDLIDKV